ncbi:uncharacterized protein [Garra rufa]|uniref:uncharacterized protein n=1 Tax=Garra rufa TaxID=137080 RepID=UPI003CCE6D06
MASPRGHHRRGSMEEPVNMSSDLINLKEELNRLNKDIFPECKNHLEKMSDLINEFESGYRLAVYARRGTVITGRIAVVFAALSFFVYDDDVSLMLAAAGAGMAVVAVLSLAFGQFKKKQQERNLKRTIKEELEGFQEKINPIIEIMEQICQRTEEILRDALLSDHKAQALREHLACFEKMPLFQEHASSKVGDQMSKIAHLTGKLSEVIAKVCSVPDILKEIIEDNKRQRDKPTKATREHISKREFKEKAEKCVNDMQKGIRTLKKEVKDFNQTADKILNQFNST